MTGARRHERSVASSVICANACQCLRERAVTLCGARDLLEHRLADAGHRGLHLQRDPVDHETIALLDEAHAGLRVDIAGGQPGAVAGERERHRETGGVRCAQDFLRVGAAAVVFEAAREAVRIVLQRAGLGADPANPLLALALPVHACGLFVHRDLLVFKARGDTRNGCHLALAVIQAAKRDHEVMKQLACAAVTSPRRSASTIPRSSC